jgi:hypothetical protein
LGAGAGAVGGFKERGRGLFWHGSLLFRHLNGGDVRNYSVLNKTLTSSSPCGTKFAVSLRGCCAVMHPMNILSPASPTKMMHRMKKPLR